MSEGDNIQDDFEKFLQENKIDISSLKGTPEESRYDAKE